MNKLENGCWYSDFNVYPNNWNTTRASVKRDWYIQYYFHDPAYKTLYPNGFQKRIKTGINRLKTLRERQEAIRDLIELEKEMLEQSGLNPITAKIEKGKLLNADAENLFIMPASQKIDEVTPETPLCDAIAFVLSKQDLDERWKKEVEMVVGLFIKAAEKLIYKERTMPISAIPIKLVKRGVVIRIIDQVERDLSERKSQLVAAKKAKNQKVTERDLANIGRMTPATYNKHWSIMSPFFTELKNREAIEHNPFDGIKQKDHIPQERDILSQEDRKKINNHLKENSYEFWRFMHIFFASGSREAEMVRIELQDVDIERRRFKVQIRKGRKRAPWKPIPDYVYPLWAEMVALGENLIQPGMTVPGNKKIFLFGHGLAPMLSEKPMSPSQITRRWKRHVKDKFGIKEDIYCLKYIYTTETVDYFSDAGIAIEQAEKIAADQNGHTTTAMVRNIYDVKSENRKLKKMVNNPIRFA